MATIEARGGTQRQAQPSRLSESETGFGWSTMLGDIKRGLSLFFRTPNTQRMNACEGK